MLNPISAESPHVASPYRARLALVAVAILAVAATAAGCTAGPATKKSTTRTTVDAAAKCTNWASLVAAFSTLNPAHISSKTKAERTAAARNIRALEKADKSFRPTVTKDIKQEIKGLQASIKTLASTVRKKADASSVPAAVAQVNASWDALVTAVGTGCPAVTATTVAP